VSDHVAVVSESFAAVIAFEGLVPRVCPHVLLQCPGGAEFLRTQLALNAAMVLGDHVLASVSSELGAMCETLVTLVTPQVLVSRVGGHVGDHLTACSEDLVTLVTLECLVRICTGRRRCARMLSDVHSQGQR